eukprot:355142-Chlamydomonas_euryale.AAC.3
MHCTCGPRSGRCVTTLQPIPGLLSDSMRSLMGHCPCCDGGLAHESPVLRWPPVAASRAEGALRLPSSMRS